MTDADLDFRDRPSCFAAVDGQQFDVVVIGAGITGCGVARDAAMRGLRVALVEAGDIAAGTSSRSSKMIHGGLRYLAQGDVSLVKEAASERQILRVIAPHLAKKCSFVVPGSVAGTTKMRAGLKMFEGLGKVPRSERHQVWNEAELYRNEPQLAEGRFSGAVVYPEFLTNDARLTLANARSAAAAGAAVLTYAPVTEMVVEAGRAVGVVCRGALPGEELAATIRARTIVNAAGPWVDAVRAIEQPDAAPRLMMTKGIHVVIPYERLPVERTIAWGAADRRTVFVVPHGPVTYLGTTDSFYTGLDEWPTIEMSDVSYVFDEVERAFGGPRLTGDDVVSMWAGIRPLVGQAGKKPSEISRKDETWIGPAGVLSIAGGKLTAYRTMAERVVDTIVERLRLPNVACRTATEPLVGGDVDVVAATAALAGKIDGSSDLVDLYGAEAAAVVAGGGDLRAQVTRAVTHEGAVTLADIWVRRTARAWFSLDPVGDNLVVAADAAAVLLGWSPQRRDAEIAECRMRHTDAMACLATPT